MQILVLGIFVGFSQAEEVAENSRLKKICKHDTMWKFQVFLSFRLYVKSILENVKSSKVSFLGALNLVFWLISNCAINDSQKSKFRESTNCAKMAVFGPLKSHTWI